MEEIKSYWYKLQKEYENKYNEKFMKDFEKSKGYLQKMEGYLQKRLDLIIILLILMLSVHLPLSD